MYVCAPAAILVQVPEGPQYLEILADPQGPMDRFRVTPDEYAPSDATTEPARESIGEAWMHLHDSYFRFMASRPSEEQHGSASSAGATLEEPQWTKGSDGTTARCNVCNKWMRIDDPLLLYGPDEPNPAMKIIEDHLKSPQHRKKLKAIKAQEEHERLEALAEEQVQEKVQLIKSLIDEHPMHLKNEWIPLGNFLKISKIDLQN